MIRDRNAEEITRLIERENVISYKKRPDAKNTLKPKEDEEDLQSAHSIKSGAHSSESNHLSRPSRNMPLPQLYKDRRKLMIRSQPNDHKPSSLQPIDRQTRQQDNLLLKQKNNFLSSENIKLKTQLMNLERENQRLQRVVEEEGLPGKTRLPIAKDMRIKAADALSLKMTIKSLRRELDDSKKQNIKIKTAIKFTTISELEAERDAITEEAYRLRQLLDEEQTRRAYLKAQHGVTHAEQKLLTLQEKNNSLFREISQLKQKLGRAEENQKNTGKQSENQKNLNKMLFNVRRLLKQKEKEIEQLKDARRETDNVSAKTNLSNKQIEPEKPKSATRIDASKERRTEHSLKKNPPIKPAAPSPLNVNPVPHKKASEACAKCPQLEQLVTKLQQENTDLKLQVQKYVNPRVDLSVLSGQQINAPGAEAYERLKRFLTYRFKAHHLTIEDAQKYLIGSQITPEELEKELSVSELSENLISEPYALTTVPYVETMLARVLFVQIPNKPFQIDMNQKVKKKVLLERFSKLVSSVEFLTQQREQEMFIQIAELVTNYYQHILVALDKRKNADGSIHQNELIGFLKEIELEEEYIDFMVTQIILDSPDLEHLNYQSLFEIFFMPPEEVEAAGSKKFDLGPSVVKEEDEEYEESKSFAEPQKAEKEEPQNKEDEQQYGEDFAEEPNKQDEYEEDYEQDT